MSQTATAAVNALGDRSAHQTPCGVAFGEASGVHLVSVRCCPGTSGAASGSSGPTHQLPRTPPRTLTERVRGGRLGKTSGLHSGTIWCNIQAHLGHGTAPSGVMQLRIPYTYTRPAPCNASYAGSRRCNHTLVSHLTSRLCDRLHASACSFCPCAAACLSSSGGIRHLPCQPAALASHSSTPLLFCCMSSRSCVELSRCSRR